MKYALPALSLLATTALATPIPDAVAAAPPAFKINKVVYGGSGCPQGTIDVDYTNSAILPIYFSKDFTASVGPNIVADQSRKNCQLNIDILYSPGYSFSVYSADYMGWGDLDDGVKGVVKAQYYFSGQTQTASSTMVLNGPFTGKYTKHDDVPISVWSPCGGEGMLNVNSEVALTPMGGSGSGTLAAVKESGRFTNVLYIKWRQC
ncbi:hypothetical protein BU26DRAFT_567210 [Trematosphaeria pertusa]|uniref:DUF4360 domain-containing protein n=1 Tax=Trematosphaeria pertusa TaxID=390896 RepID=A0A6A6I919_9PLEO|nr:uncharacterized protein BU26DRAFT_567210 [Trematosphaeria pertusa]KAF2246866.1 hypothetical protein BU26DRAFT_567210 [Trematosphaeria pertusa]